MRKNYQVAWWDEEKNLLLITRDIFNDLPEGTELTAIDGEKVLKGFDEIDLDARLGFIAYGFAVKPRKISWLKRFKWLSRKKSTKLELPSVAVVNSTSPTSGDVCAAGASSPSKQD